MPSLGSFYLNWLEDFYLTKSYYFIVVFFLIWLFVVFKALLAYRQHVRNFIKIHLKAFIITFMLSIFVFCSIGRYYRVLNDEIALLSVARSMSVQHRVDFVTEAQIRNGILTPTQSIIEIRPFLFPFFTHLFHLLLGYHPENVFLLNFFALWGLLFAAYLFVLPYVTFLWAIIATLLLLSQPIILLIATSGGYEVLNLLFVVVSLLNLRWFINSRLPIAFQLLFFNLLILANIRYESVIFFIVIMFSLWVSGYLKKQDLFKSKILWGAPLICLPWILQKFFNLTNNQQLVTHEYRWLYRFHWRHIDRNFKDFVTCVSDVSGSSGFAGIVNILGVIAFAWGIFLFIKNRKSLSEANRLFISLSFLALLVHFFIILQYGGGFHTNPINARYYFPEILMLSLLPVVFLFFLTKSKRGVVGVALGLTAACFLSYHSIAKKDLFSSNNTIIKQNQFVRNFLKAKNEKNSLIIYFQAAQHIAYNQAAISFDTANQYRDQILKDYKEGVYTHIYVIQKIPYATLKSDRWNTTDPSYKLKKIVDEPMDSVYFLRISQVI